MLNQKKTDLFLLFKSFSISTLQIFQNIFSIIHNLVKARTISVNVYKTEHENRYTQKSLCTHSRRHNDQHDLPRSVSVVVSRF